VRNSYKDKLEKQNGFQIPSTSHRIAWAKFDLEIKEKHDFSRFPWVATHQKSQAVIFSHSGSYICSQAVIRQLSGSYQAVMNFPCFYAFLLFLHVFNMFFLVIGPV